MLYRIKCVSGFLDGNVFPRFIKPGEVVEVDEATFAKMKQSAPDGFEWESAEKIVPPSTVKKEKKPKKGEE